MCERPNVADFFLKKVFASLSKMTGSALELGYVTGGLLKYDLGTDVPLKLESRPIFIPNFAEK